MNPIFPIITIFILVIILFFLSQIIIKVLWKYKTKINSTKTVENIGIAIALFALFLMLMFAIYSAINILTDADSPSPSNAEQVKVIDTIDGKELNRKDCQQLINEIYLGESKVYNSENHRYIEVVSSANNINKSYQEGAKELRSIAQQYLGLELQPESKYYSQLIGEKLKEKATLFEQRGKIIADKNNQKQIEELLKQMDSVTKARLNAIESVESQCNQKGN